MKKICIICKQEFETRDSRTVCCKNIECRKQYNRLKYAKDTTECTCMICKKTYLATRKQRHDCCPDCIQSEPHIFKNQVEQKHCCRQCKKVLFTKIKNVTQNIPEFVYDKTCDDCKEKNKQAASKRMMLNNPSYKNKSYSSIEDAKATKKLKQENKRKYKTKDEMKAAFSERMKQNNPMFNIDSRQKARETLKKRIEAGEITYN